MNTVPLLDSRPEPARLPKAPLGQGTARQYHARLLMRDGQRYCALTDEGAIWVHAAAGCLLQPEVGDVALVSIAGAGGYVLTILERAQPGHDTVLAVAGRLRVEARQVEIAADQEVTVEAGTRMQLRAADASMQFGTLSMEGTKLHARWTQQVEVNKQRINIADYAESHWGHSVRRIATHEEVTAASMRQTATRDWSVRAATAGVVGRERVAIDGDAVQIG